MGMDGDVYLGLKYKEKTWGNKLIEWTVTATEVEHISIHFIGY